MADACSHLVDLSTTRAVHVVGVGGAGMSAIATVLAAMGHQVTGSDLKDGPATDRLRARGIAVAVGHDAANVGDVDLVARSTAVPDSNPEVAIARERGIPVASRADVLAAICGLRRTVSVAGSHGKTTTSSMLALVLREGGVDPGFIIGGEVNEIGTGASWGDGEWFVVEADESDGTFLTLPTELAVVTSVEPDHLEHWGGWDALRAAFEAFARSVTNAVVCVDDEAAAALASSVGAVTYGTSEGAAYRIVDVDAGRSSTSFAVEHDGGIVARISLPVPGLHNARNATAALVAALQVGVDAAATERALGRFGGVARRFQFRGEAAGVTFVDDYAHLPGEVASMLRAVQDGGWRRVVCVFQPHRYSRTEALWRDFADAFEDADLLVVTDVYPAHEAPRPGVTGRLVVQAVLDAHPGTAVAYLPGRRELTAYLAERLRPGDLCLTLGAGDLTSLPDELVTALGGTR